MNVELTSVTVQRVPLLEQLLAAVSIDQILRTMSGSGLEFAKLDGTLRLEGSEIFADRIAAHGGSLGITTRGSVDLASREVTLQGVVVPLFRASQLIGKIPLLRDFLLTGEGEGILSVPYSISGSFEDLHFDVQKGAVLKPGVLSDILGE
jgi:hypothetical protein